MGSVRTNTPKLGDQLTGANEKMSLAALRPGCLGLVGLVGSVVGAAGLAENRYPPSGSLR
jgi:hypothetical protein